jgi:MFS family permease
MTGFIGLIMMSACTNVQTYAGAQVFYWVGFNGMSYVLNVFMADTSSLRNRALVFAFSITPYIGTTFAGPALAQEFYTKSSWRWGHGVWTIFTPLVCLPFFAIVIHNQRKAAVIGLAKSGAERAPAHEGSRSLIQSISYWLWEFDFIGILLVCAGFVLLLLPLALASYQKNKWQSGSIIAMFILGSLCLVGFALYEKYFSRKCFIPFGLLLDRTVTGACLLSMNVFISFYCWDAYYSSYLQVVHNLSIKHAGYVSNIYSIGSSIFAVLVGIMIRYTGRFKIFALCFGVPLYVLSTGLMIYFRQAHTPIGYIIMCQILIAFAGATLVISEQLAVMAASSHQNVAAVLAFIGLFSSIGGGIGAAISGAIWTNTLPQELLARLPNGFKPKYLDIYASLPVQLTYEWGSPIRNAIIEAYAATQVKMIIAATASMAISFIFVAIWRDIKVTDIKNVKGRVL